MWLVLPGCTWFSRGQDDFRTRLRNASLAIVARQQARHQLSVIHDRVHPPWRMGDSEPPSSA
ncbi:hypothetical protein E2C01_095982 [Portunus trituberculatus]|uniref:Uncharacterized protein n=1 Tax=Portunus trituberculatus TaxID=210409 RepID=A0A5B7K1U7_PORTR|nr:hypothetical protein [Portunus trituberculatus]